MILVWGVLRDPPVAAVLEALERYDHAVFFLDQHEALQTELSLCVDGAVGGILRSPRGSVELPTVMAAYIRPFESRRLFAAAGAPRTDAARASDLDDALLCWSEITVARVVNRPSAMASNNSKPYQATLIEAQGFAIPETLITTDIAALEAFWECHGEIIYKSLSGVRSIVTRLGPQHRGRFVDVANCPTQFQQWVSGTDFRVHVVGEDIFSCEVNSSATDYRYPRNDDERPKLRPRLIPGDIAYRCRCLTASLGLDLAGIDLRRGPEGQWYCFEVNPSPGFTYYEEATGQPIADAVARLLRRPRQDSPGQGSSL